MHTYNVCFSVFVCVFVCMCDYGCYEHRETSRKNSQQTFNGGYYDFRVGEGDYKYMSDFTLLHFYTCIHIYRTSKPGVHTRAIVFLAVFSSKKSGIKYIN